MLTRSFACLLAAAPAAAQDLTVGAPAPELTVAEWLHGEPIELAKPGDTKVVVVELWATWCGPCRAAMPHLTALQRRLRERGVRVAGVSWSDDRAAVRRLVESEGDAIGYSIAFDDGDVGAAYMEGFGQQGIPCAFVVDVSEGEPRVAWIGHPEAGLDAAVEEVLDGAFDYAFARKMVELRPRIEQGWRERDWVALRALAGELVLAGPAHGEGYALEIQVLLASADDRDAALAMAVKASKALASWPRRLSRFADSCLLAAGPDDFAELALEVLARVPDTSAGVELLRFRALDRLDRVDEAAVKAEALVEAPGEDRAQLIVLAQWVAGVEHSGAYAKSALRALDRAAAEQPLEQAELRLRFTILALGLKDWAAADAAGRAIADAMDDKNALNDWAWTLLTEAEYEGKLHQLALYVAERMGHADGLDHFMLDTLALAKFENGLVDEAIALQKRALAQGGKDDQDYVDRLARYEAAKSR